MSAALEQVLARFDKLEHRIGQVEGASSGLAKLVEGNARRKGLRPQDLVAEDTRGGSLSGFYGPDGVWRPVGARGRKSMGPGADEFLKALAYLSSDHPTALQRREWAVKTLSGPDGKGLEQRLSDGSTRVHKIFGDDGQVLKTALAESQSGQTGGYVVPPAFLEQLQYLQIENTFLRPRAFKQPMSTLTLTIPSLDMTTAQSAGTTPVLGGVKATWTAEAATRAESEPKFRQTELKAHELSFYAVASNTFLADQAVGLDSLLTQIFAWAIGWYTEYAYLQGTGVGQPLGILNCPATLQVTRETASQLHMADVMAMYSKLYYMLRGNTDTVFWAAHPSCIPNILRFNDETASSTGVSTGRFAWIDHQQGMREAVPESGGMGAQGFGTLLGHPLFITEKLPALGTTGCFCLIDGGKYVLGDRMDTAVDISPHVNFLTNQTVWRVVWRGDGQPWLNSSVTLADGTYTVSPFVTLTQ
jgi:HK97 family phage major capsid protein